MAMFSWTLPEAGPRSEFSRNDSMYVLKLLLQSRTAGTRAWGHRRCH